MAHPARQGPFAPGQKPLYSAKIDPARRGLPRGRPGRVPPASSGRQVPVSSGGVLKALLAFSRAVDWLNERVGQVVYWLVLAAVLISAANAVVRKVFNTSSNSFLEVQWYLFSAIFLFCAGYTLLRNQHVRIDVIAGRLSKRAQAWIDIFGTIFFLMPMALMIMYLSWPVFVQAFQRHEVSTNAGGLVIWPARLLVPIGFLLLILQGASELIKRVAFLMGRIPDPTEKQDEKSAEEQLAEEILRQRGDQTGAQA
jgi:TRAP-type mannitol/chloroaromatic compound transport system permease small subunit